MSQSDHPLRGALLVTLAALMFASMGVLIRAASTAADTEQVVFLRNLFGLLFLLPLVMRRGFAASLRTQYPGWLLLRSLLGLVAMYCFFYALSQLPLAEAVLLNFTAPLFVPFAAMLILGERVGTAVGVAILIGFLGVLLVLNPSHGVYSMAALIGLASGAFAGLAMVTLRKLSATEPAGRVVLYYGLYCTGISALPALLDWHTPPPLTIVQLAAAGAFATLGQFLLSKGYSYAPAAQVAPFSYSAVVFAAFYGWLFWSELPGWMTLAGTLLIAGAGVLAIRKHPWRLLSGRWINHRKPPGNS